MLKGRWSEPLTLRGVLEDLNTRNDPCLLVVENATDKLEESVRGKKTPHPFNNHRGLSLLRKTRANRVKAKFSHTLSRMPACHASLTAANQDAAELTKIVLSRGKPANIQHSRATLLAELCYALRILIGLLAKPALGDGNIRGKERHTIYTIAASIADVEVYEVRASGNTTSTNIGGGIGGAVVCPGLLEGSRRPKDHQQAWHISGEVATEVYEVVGRR